MSSLLKSERIKRINKTSKEILMNFALFYIKGDNDLFLILLLVVSFENEKNIDN